MNRLLNNLIVIILVMFFTYSILHRVAFAQKSELNQYSLIENNDYFCNLAMDGTFQSFTEGLNEYNTKFEEVINKLICTFATSSKPKYVTPLWAAMVSQKGNIGSFTKDAMLYLISVDKVDVFTFQIYGRVGNNSPSRNLFDEIRYHYQYAEGNEALRREFQSAVRVICRMIKLKSVESLAEFYSNECPFQPWLNSANIDIKLVTSTQCCVYFQYENGAKVMTVAPPIKP